MALTDRQRFESFLHAMTAGSEDEMTPLLADDVVWNLPPFADAPPVKGREAVLQFIRQGQSAYYEPGSLRLEPILVSVDDGRIAYLGTMTANTKHGRPYENRYAFFARMRDGLLKEVWELMDTVKFQAQLRRPKPD